MQVDLNAAGVKSGMIELSQQNETIILHLGKIPEFDVVFLVDGSSWHREGSTLPFVSWACGWVASSGAWLRRNPLRQARGAPNARKGY